MTKRSAIFLVAVTAIALLISVPVKADPITVTLTGVNGESQGNVYTSPYYAMVGNTPGFIVICDDFVHDVTVGESWTANVSTFADLSSVRFAQATPAATLLLYEEAGWLVDNLFTDPADATNISFAIWALFEPTATQASSGYTLDAAGWLAAAQNPILTSTFTAAEFSNIQILTPTDPGPGSAQEYLEIVPTPESSTMLMLAVGLLGLLAMAGVKARSQKQALLSTMA